MEIEISNINSCSIFRHNKVGSIKKTDIKMCVSNIFNKKCSDMLGWLDLPDIDSEQIEDILQFAKSIKKRFKNFVVLGIGGSALGVKMLKYAFFDSINKKEKIKTFVLDNIDGDYFVSLLNSLDLKKTAFNIITKSGTTCETITQMSIVLNLLKKKKINVQKNLFVTTSKGNSLYDYANNLGLKTFIIPKDVGGRFSVLSPVGLVPASIMGIDIVQLLNGAKNVRENAKSSSSNLAYISAHICSVALNNGLTNIVFMPYSQRLKLVSEYFAQLWAESLGKRYNRQGREVFTGQTPIKALGVTDQHSQLQLYSEGRNDKLFVFLKVKSSSFDITASDNIPFMLEIKNISLSKLLNNEFDSTRLSLAKLDRPSFAVFLDSVDEFNMGELIFYLQTMTAFMGEMLNINAYDQNGVEQSKLYTKASLGFEGLEKQKNELEKFRKNQKFLQF